MGRLPGFSHASWILAMFCRWSLLQSTYASTSDDHCHLHTSLLLSMSSMPWHPGEQRVELTACRVEGTEKSPGPTPPDLSLPYSHRPQWWKGQVSPSQNLLHQASNFMCFSLTMACFPSEKQTLLPWTKPRIAIFISHGSLFNNHPKKCNLTQRGSAGPSWYADFKLQNKHILCTYVGNDMNTVFNT